MRAAPTRRLVPALVAAWLLALAPAASADEYVQLGPTGFVPPQVTVDAGETIHFSSSGTGEWSVTANDGLFDSKTLPGEGGYSMRLSVPGSHAYHSTGPGGFGGRVVVRGRTLGGDDDDLANERIPDLEFPPVRPEDIGVEPRFGVKASMSRIMLGFRPGATVEQANAALAGADVRVIGGLPSLGILLVEPGIPTSWAGPFEIIESALAELRGSRGVLFASMSPVVDGLAVPRRAEDATASNWDWDAPLSHGNWGLTASQFPTAWNLLETIQRKHPTAITGIVDKGFEPHPDLPGLDIKQQLCPRGSTECRAIGNEPDAHGNHVAGVIGAAYDNEAEPGRSRGVSGGNPVARMHGYSARAFSEWPTSVAGSTLVDKQLELYDLILRSRPPELRVINHSMGAATFDGAKWQQAFGTKLCGPGTRDDDLPELATPMKGVCTPDTLDEWQREMANVGRAAAAVVREASRQGVMIVQAAGNEGATFCPGGTCQPVDAASRGEFAWVSRHWDDPGIAEPGLTNPVLVAQSVRADGTPRPDSTFGGDIAAPGDEILSTVLGEDYAVMGGSSIATPYVTGLAGYLLADDPSLSLAELRRLILDWANGRPAGGSLDFSWTMPDKANRDVTGDGLVDYLDARWQLEPFRYDVDLDACDASISGKPIGTYTWSVGGEIVGSTSSCRHRWRPWNEGEYSVTLTATGADGVTETVTKTVTVQDLLIVSVGDSIGSGEANPEIASPFSRWQLERCHRSAFGGPAQASRWLEAADARSSVSFLHLACSGGRMEGDRGAGGVLKPGFDGIGGLLTPYEGVTEDSDDGPCAASGRTDLTTCEPPQLEAAKALVGARTPDALLVSIGANDMQFSSILTECLKPLVDCSTSDGGKGLFERRLQLLPERYARVAAKIRVLWPDLPSDRVIITQYPDVTTDETGQVNLDCGVASGIEQVEADWAHDVVIPLLNFEVAKAAGAHGWTLADGIPQEFVEHGYCSSDPWIQSILGSFWHQGDKNGAFHPNYAGHSAYAKHIVAALRDRLGLNALAQRPRLRDTAPRLNAYRALAGNGPASRVADAGDPSEDGNRRVARSFAADGTVIETPDTRRGHVEPEKTAPDGRVDMRDLRRYRDAWLQRCLTEPDGCPAEADIALDGGDEHVKRDLNLDGCVTECGAREHYFARVDFNGDEAIDPANESLVPWKEDGTPVAGRADATRMSDLDVLESAWTGGAGAEGWTKSDLTRLMRSADLEVHADAVLDTGAGKAEVEVRETGGAAVGPRRTVRRRDGAIVMTVPVTSTAQEYELVAVSTTDKGTMRSTSAPFTLSYGEDRAVAVCPEVSLKASPASLPADGASTSIVTATLHRCPGREDVAGRPVTFTMTPADGGASLTAMTEETDAAGRAQATFRAGTVAKSYTVEASVAAEEGADPMTAEAEIEVAPRLTVKYVWQQYIEEWHESGTTRWGAFDPLLPDCTAAGMEYCIDEFEVGLRSQTLGGVQRAGTLTGGGSNFRLTEAVSNSPASSESSWSLTFNADGETEEGGKVANWWVTDPNAYTDAPVDGLRVADEPGGLRLSGLQAVGDLPYHYALWGTSTGGTVDPIEGHVANNGYLLIPQGAGARIRFAAQPDEDVRFGRAEEGFRPFQSCGVLDEDLTTEPGYYVAGTSDYIPGATTVSRKLPYAPGDRPMPVGPGRLKVRYAFAAVAAYDGQPLADPVLPDCAVSNPPHADFVVEPSGGTAREGRQVHFADRSTDPDNDIVSRTWDYGDGKTASGVSAHHIYDDDGTYTVTITVKDAKGNTDTETREVVVANEPPEADIDDLTAKAGQVDLRYRILDPGAIDKKQLEWRITSTNAAFPATHGTDHAGVWSRGPYAGLPAGTYPLTLTVRDKDGATARDDAVLVVLADTPPPPPPGSTRAYATCDPNVKLDAEEREFLDLVNEYREENGLRPVGVSATLVRAADRHAADMAEHDFMAHTGSDGSSPADRARDAGYPRSAGVGENLAETETGFDSLWAWRSSSAGHNENMLDPAWRAIGIARKQGAKWRWATSYGTALDCAAVSPEVSGGAPLQPAGGVRARHAGSPPVEDAARAPSALALAEPVAEAERLYPPTTAVALSRNSPRAGKPVEVVNRSRDSRGTPIGARLEFHDDESTADLAPDGEVTHTYPDADWTDFYDVTVTAKDASNRTSSFTRWVRVEPIPAPWLAALAGADFGVIGRPYTVEVDVTDDDTGDPLPDVELTFTLGDRVATATSDANGLATASILPLDEEGWQTITITSTATEDLKSRTITKSIQAYVNHAPVAKAGGPYVSGEGGSLLLNGSRSADPDPDWFDHIDAYAWDLDGDGAFDDAEGRLPSVLEGDELTQKVCGTACTPDHAYPIRLRVTDSHGDTGVDSTSVRFVPDFDLLLGGANKTVVPGQSNSFAVTVIGSKSYDKPVTLSAVDLPAGVTATFSKNPVTPTGVSVLTLTAGNELEQGTFPVKVSATDGTLTKEVSDELKVAFGLVPICTGQITGVVTDVTTGAPIGGASVVGAGLGTTTDANGRYLLDEVELGWNNAPETHSLTARNAGYWQAEESGQAACGAVTRVDLALLDVRTSTVKGDVVDKETGEPLSGAEVQAHRCDAGSCGYQKVADTDAQGAFEDKPILGPQNTPTKWIGRAQKAGYWWDAVAPAIEEGKVTTTRFELLKKCTGTLAGGRVVFRDSAGTETPAAGAGVGVHVLNPWTPDVLATADELGFFTIDKTVDLAYLNQPISFRAKPSVPPGAPQGAVAYEGYFQVGSCGAQATVKLIIQVPKRNFGAIEGKVTDAETGAPLPGVWVNSCPGCGSAKTDDQGAYRLDNVYIGDDGNTSAFKTASVEPPGYYTASGGATVTAGGTATIDIKAVRKRTGKLTAEVVDSVTGAPVPGARIAEGSCSFFCAHTDRGGFAKWPNVALGHNNAPVSKHLTASAGGYWPQAKTVTVKAGEETTVRYELQPECDPAKVVGTVVNAETQEPIQGAAVSAPLSSPSFTDAQGRFEITDIRPSTGNNPRQVWLTASASGYYSATKQITIFCGARIRVDFGSRTTKTGTIVGTATDADTGQKLANTFIGTEFGATTTTDAEGHYRIEDVPLGDLNAPREWKVIAQPVGYKPSTRPVTVVADAEVRRDFAFSKANQPPAAAGGEVTLDEDTEKPFTVAGTDPDGDALTYHVMKWPQHGRLLGRLPNATYEPDDHYNGPDSFEYIVNDGVASSARATVTIAVGPVNDPPGAMPDYFDSAPDTTLRIPATALLGNDKDVDGEPLKITSVRPNHPGATVAIEGDEVVFEPPPGWKSQTQYAFFDYTIADAAGKTSTAWVYIRVDDGPSAPNCPDASFPVKAGQTLQTSVTCTDKNGDALTYALVGGPQQGELDFEPDGSFTFTPPTGFVGSTSFTFRASDGALESSTATVHIHVVPLNRAPACADVDAAGQEDTPLDVTLTCTDPDGDALTFELTGQPARGVLARVSEGTYRYTPGDDWSGDDEFGYRADDGKVKSAPAEGRLHIAARNDRPVCDDVALSVEAGGSASVAPDCSDADGDAMTYEIVAQGAKGAASVAAGRLRFRAPAEAAGDDAFTYAARDATEISEPARAGVSIQGKPDPAPEPSPDPTPQVPPAPSPPPGGVQSPPVAVDDEIRAAAGSDAVVATETLLANDRDPDGDPLTVTAVSGAKRGTVGLEGGSVRFRPDAGFTGVGRFVYELSDGRGGTGRATVFVLVGDVTGADLLLGCDDRRVVLEDVVPAGRRVRLTGFARREHAGERVAIRFLGSGKVVARPVVAADGGFSATAPIPPARLRDSNRARYVAAVGGHRSMALKLMRRVQVTDVDTARRRFVIRGRVTGVLARSARERQIEVRRSTCATDELLGAVRPRRNGSFVARLPVPADAAAVVFRLHTKVRRSRGSEKLFDTFSLPRVAAR